MHKIALLLSTLALYSCQHGIESPASGTQLAVKFPAKWKEAGQRQHGKISKGWLAQFNSPRMSQLVNEALERNQNLKIVESQLRASWATARTADSDLKPSLSGTVGTSRRRSGSDQGLGNGNYNFSTNASWEIDLWGLLKDRVDATHSDYQADVLDLRNARLSLAANTARAWCNLITAEQQLELAEKTLHSFQKNKRIVERNYKAGITGTSSLAVQLSRSNVSSAQSSLRNRQLQRDSSARTLEILLGRYPTAELKSTNTLPTLTTSIPSGLPAQLLSRRPDIASAELAVYSAAKRADVARKSLLPSLRFSSSLSSGSNQISDIFRFDNLVANAAANLTQTIYNGGQLKAAAKSALERHQASIHAYANTVLQAAGEVEQAIATDSALRQQETFLQEQTKSSTLAEAQAERDYSEGIEGVGILEVLESQRRANNARSSLINIRNQRLQNRISLHLALGGDFITS